MDDRKKTLAAVTVIIGILLLVAIVVGILVSSKKILSPVPEDDAIKIIFITPTSVPRPTESETPSPTTKATVTKKATPIPTKKPVTPTSTPQASASATPIP